MRVIAGEFKGRFLLAPQGRSTRPTGDRVREAIFSMLGAYFDGGRCLDLFAGSGALGIEAISRGVELAVFVDRSSAGTVRENLRSLGAQTRARVLPVSHHAALSRLSQEGARFDLVFLDPPYGLGLLLQTMSILVERELLCAGAFVVAEMDARTPVPEQPSLKLLREAVYGTVKVAIYRFGPRAG
ncbi:MAG: 16S rRNA (guanine(966)-N(2))-methyltransferase RsmD [Bacilli bacterium]